MNRLNTRRWNRSFDINRKARLGVQAFEERVVPAIFTAQQGVGGYTGTQDTVLFSALPNAVLSEETAVSVDQQDSTGAQTSGVRQGLLRFNDIFTDDPINNPGLIPFGSTINSAKITMVITNESSSNALISLSRMTVDWNPDTASWNFFKNPFGGLQSDEGEKEALADFTLFDPDVGTRDFDVKSSLEAWSGGAANFGWVFESGSTNGWDFQTSEAAANQPLLTVDFTPPTGAGSINFATATPIHNEGDSGSSVANISVTRLGGSAGLISATYTITAGTATAGDDVVLGSGTISFAAGKNTPQTIPVTINGDGDIEGTETVFITITGPEVPGGSQKATLSIADDDLLINEVLSNVSNTLPVPNEQNSEYIELLGTPNKTIPSGTYFVVFEGNEAELGGFEGQASGIADLVYDLSGKTFGSSGLIVLTPSTWNYTVPSGTVKFAWSDLDTGNKLEDSSQTYAIIYSPINPMVQGTDYDTVGKFESSSGKAAGNGVGILELPAGSFILDSVGYSQGGSNDRDRILSLAYPGVRIAQSKGINPSVNGAPDAISRVAGNRAPNSIGSWFNGEIVNAAIPAAYSLPPNANANLPAGAQITPGEANILRTIGFASATASVQESAGTINVVVTRAGDTSVKTSFKYATAGGTAISGSDFTPTSGTAEFDIGESTVSFNIPINNADGIPEGFESFSVTLSNPQSPFLISSGKLTVTINDADAKLATFQNGDANGYVGTADAAISGSLPTDFLGVDLVVSVDEEDAAVFKGPIRPNQSLLRFDDVFGNKAGQVPIGSTIYNAFITFNVNNPSSSTAAVRFFQMLQPWDEDTATWSDPQGSAGSSIVNGITPDNVEARAFSEAVVPTPDAAGFVNVPVSTDTVQAWANGDLNYGWAIISNSADDWNFDSSEGLTPSLRPQLNVIYTEPSGPGVFRLSSDEYIVNENGTATITVQRVGGTTGNATVTFDVGNLTADGADFTSPATGSVIFTGSQTTGTFQVKIFDDGIREQDQTLSLTISGAGLTFDRSTAELVIRDNDFNTISPNMLLNEMHVNSPGSDVPWTYQEFSGEANTGLGGLYYIALDGNGTPRAGGSELIVDLTKFVNGSNGLTIHRAAVGGFTTEPGTTIVANPTLDSNDPIDSTGSLSHVFIYAPNSTLTSEDFDYDWDNDGILELPTGAVIVDAVGHVTGSNPNDKVYGGVAISTAGVPSPDNISRIQGNSTALSSSAWFHGDVLQQGDDPQVYEDGNSSNLPVPGAAGTPGSKNTGILAVSPLVTLGSVTINGGAQRSMVTQLSLNFDGIVTHTLVPAFKLTDQSGKAIADVNLNIGGLYTNTITITFSGPATSAGSLPDGKYRLNIDGQSVIANGRAADTNLTVGADLTGSDGQFNFHRLLGDGNGDAKVDSNDFILFRAAFNTSPPNPLYDAAFDFDGDGKIDSTDFIAFRSRFNTSI